MKQVKKISPSAMSVLNNPSLMQYVRDKKQDEPDTKTMKAQVRILREIYRFLRDRPIIYGAKIFPIIEDIQGELAKLFPDLDKAVIKLAVYIETNTSVLPMNPFPLWVEVPTRDIVNIIGNSLLAYRSRTKTYTLLGTYLWMSLSGYESHFIDEFSFEMNQMEYLYGSFGVEDETVRNIWKELSISVSQRGVGLGNNGFRKSRISIGKISPLWRHLHGNVDVGRVKFNRTTKLGLNIPDFEDLLARFTGYSFLYPVDDHGDVNKSVPLFYQSEKKVRVPLTKNIVPVLVGALLQPEELGWLLKAKGTSLRNSKVRTLLKQASKSIVGIDNQLKRFNAIAIKGLPARHRSSRHGALQVFNTMSHNGLRVDLPTLNSIDVDSLDPNRHNLSSLKEERVNIRNFVENSYLQRLYAKYRFHVYTERVYSRHYPIQNLPSVFKKAIILDEGFYFLYFDIVANDLSMLFNLSSDGRGLSVLQANGDPYSVIADHVFPGSHDRKKVKAFINPWLYGAGTKRIVEKSKGTLSILDVRKLKEEVPLLFPQAGAWLKQIKLEVERNGYIPARMNPLEGLDIPIPTKLARTLSPALIMQRLGVSLFRLLLVRLADYGYEPVIFIHDSVLAKVPVRTPKEEVLIRLRSILADTISIKNIDTLVVKMGTGLNWSEAEDPGERYPIQSRM